MISLSLTFATKTQPRHFAQTEKQDQYQVRRSSRLSQPELVMGVEKLALELYFGKSYM